MRWTALTLLLALAATSAGCGGEPSTAASGPAGETPTTDIPTPSNEPAAGGETLETALAQAKETGRNVLVIYASKSCSFSRQMDSQTLSDDAVKAALDKLVVLRVEQGENSSDFEAAWGRQPTPTILTLDADGEPLGQMLSGVVAKSDFLAYAAWAETGEGSQPSINVGGG
jgi:thiol:disulfide interchange protein